MTDEHERGFAEAIDKAVEVVRPKTPQPKCCDGCADCWDYRHEMAASIRALSPSHDTVRVPREPTEAMIAAAIQSMGVQAVWTWADQIDAIYRAMIAEVK